jgi:polyisoprenoid-binding protein YceI
LTVGGSFEAKTGALTGELVLDAEQRGVVAGELEVDLRTLQTGIGLRDNHMRERYLEVHRGETFAAATLDRIRLEGLDPLNPTGKATFRGVLMLHGQEREVTGTADIRRTAQALRVQATFPIKVTDFEIANPTYLGVGVRNELVVAVNFKVTPKRQL